MKTNKAALCCAFGLLAGPLAGHAAGLSAAEVFARVAPSVAPLEMVDAEGVRIDLRSAVRVAGDRWVTVCEGLSTAASLNLALPSGPAKARLTTQDAQRNLCAVATFEPVVSTPPVPLQATTPRPGARVYAVSNALGLGIGISDGLVGGVRPFATGSYIQFSAPVSPGSHGGAVVDEEGQLLGIIEYRNRGGQNLNFAAPSAWLEEMDRRAADQQMENQWDLEAAALAGQARWAELGQHAQVWSASNPRALQAWLYAAQAAQQLMQPRQEELAWQAVQSLDPGSSRGGIGLGTAWLKQGRVEEARGLVEKLLAHERENAAIWMLQGHILQASRRTVDAEAAYRRATELDPWLLMAHTSLASLAQQRGDFPAAVATWARLCGLFPDHAAFAYELVQAQLQANQPAQAYRTLAALPAAEAASATASYWKGVTLRRLGRPVEAIQVLRDGIGKSPKGRLDAWIVLSIALSDLRRHPEAIDAAQNALESDPGSARAKYWLAFQLKAGGRAAQAVGITRELVAALPGDAGMWRLHGLTLSALGEWAQAVSALEKSLALEPKQAEAWAALADAHHAQGHEGAVRHAYAQMRSIDPESADALHRRLMVVYEEGTP